jgi:bifunctional non-homologous end joining protein LigD
MLAVTAAAPFDSGDHWFELKWDGIRCIAFVERGRTRLQSRNLKDITGRYPAFSMLGERLREGHSRAVLDGELIGFHAGRPSFQAALRAGGARLLVCFDLLYLDGEDLTGLPLTGRRELLEDAVAAEGELLLSGPVAGAGGKSFFHKAAEQGLEGVIGKRLESRYHPGVRSREWLKIVARKTIDCLVCGLTAGAVPVKWQGRAIGFGSLVVGLPDGDGLRYLGNVGTGWDSRRLAEVLARLRPRDSAPFARGLGPPGRIARATCWVEPEQVAEIAYREVTPDGVLRHPSFLRLRPDREPAPGGG